MSDRSVLKLGGKAIRLQRFIGWVIAPALLLGTFCNFYFHLNFLSALICVWLVVAVLYTVAEGIRRIVLGALDIPKAE